MKNKKLAAIPLLIAITLSIFGFVYAIWSDMVYIDGTAKMGSLTLAFSTAEEPACEEYYPNPDPGGFPEFLKGEVGGKDVGYCNASYSGLFQDVHSEKWGYSTLDILVQRAYPQYRVHTTFILHNIGTIPFYVYGIELTGEKKNATGTVIHDLLLDWWIDPVTGNFVGEIYEDVDGSGDISLGDILVINVELKNEEFPTQIDPCKDDKMEIDLDFKQEAEECHTYTLHFKVLAVQWNKLDEVFP